MNSTKPSKGIHVVIGLGRSGLGAARLLNKQGKDVLILEQSIKEISKSLLHEFNSKGIKLKLGTQLDFSNFQKLLPEIKSVVTSPGIPWDHPTLTKIRNMGITIESEISLSWKALMHIPWIGVTGTNGKTTVTYLLDHILKYSQINSLMAGNVGIPASEIALNCLKVKKSEPDWLIMELSSYQIETAPNISPKIGIWTNLTPDHLERHGSMENYSNIKKKLLDNSLTRIYNFDDPYLKSKKSELKQGIWISAEYHDPTVSSVDFCIDSDGMLLEKGKAILDTSLLNVPGKHNRQNLLLVTAAARQLGMPGLSIQKAISSFKGVPHRLEEIGKFNQAKIYNDSKATNYDAAETALEAIEKPSIVIAGGRAKTGNPIGWITSIKYKACAVILFGESSRKLNNILKDAGFKGDIYCCQSLNKAVKIVFEIASKNQAKSILFSPACASFDQYKDYEERGESFKKLIAESLRTSSQFSSFR